MAEKLRLSALPDDKPVKVSVELPAAVWRDLELYAALIVQDAEAAPSGAARPPPGAAKLIAPMVERFMASDRVFAKLRRSRQSGPSARE